MSRFIQDWEEKIKSQPEQGPHTVCEGTFPRIESVFRKERDLTLSPFYARLARCGVEIYLRKIKFDAIPSERVKLFDENGFFALGEVREFDEGLAIKPIKQF